MWSVHILVGEKRRVLLADNKRVIFAHTFVRSMGKVKGTDTSRLLKADGWQLALAVRSGKYSVTVVGSIVTSSFPSPKDFRPVLYQFFYIKIVAKEEVSDAQL